jgi:hypothetical protein
MWVAMIAALRTDAKATAKPNHSNDCNSGANDGHMPLNRANKCKAHIFSNRMFNHYHAYIFAQ